MRDLFEGITLAEFLRAGLKVVLILVLALLLARLGSRFASRSIRSLATRSPLREAGPRSEQRATTLAGVAVSLIRIVVWTMAGLLVLGVLGLDLGPFPRRGRFGFSPYGHCGHHVHLASRPRTSCSCRISRTTVAAQTRAV